MRTDCPILFATTLATLLVPACMDVATTPSPAPGDSVDASSGAETAQDTTAADSTIGLVTCPDQLPTLRPEGWGVQSHCKGVEPDYDGLFDGSRVHRFDITIDPAQWDVAMANLEALYPAGPGGPGGGPGGGTQDNPEWIPVTVAYDGLTWTHVGFRFKGNSSLRTAYRQGKRKLAFRLNFDKFEGQHPSIDNQRFWGFDKMTFSSGFKDDTLIRDKLAAEIFRGAGVPAARSVFAPVFVDVGDGSTYFGLYTMIEDPSDEMLGVQFADAGGNLYKPDGPSASWATLDLDDFAKKTNEDDADFGDVEDAYAALHASPGDAASWRSGLEAHFNVEAFLRALAVNQSIVNWDSYGTMTHNYYLYADPSDGGRLCYFPWDLNEAMLIRQGGPGGGGVASVMLDEIGSQWPLIRHLLDDPIYRADYAGYVSQAVSTGFDQVTVVALARAYHDLIAPWVTGPDGVEAGIYSHLSSPTAFSDSVDGPGGLAEFIAERHAAVEQALVGR